MEEHFSSSIIAAPFQDSFLSTGTIPRLTNLALLEQENTNLRLHIAETRSQGNERLIQMLKETDSKI